MATLSLVSLSLCILIMFNPELSHFYLACIGREELFGWVILAQLLTLLQLNKNYVLFLVKPNCSYLLILKPYVGLRNDQKCNILIIYKP